MCICHIFQSLDNLTDLLLATKQEDILFDGGIINWQYSLDSKVVWLRPMEMEKDHSKCIPKYVV